MLNRFGMTETIEALQWLADQAELPQDKRQFDLTTFIEEDTCGTVCCVIGKIAIENEMNEYHMDEILAELGYGHRIIGGIVNSLFYPNNPSYISQNDGDYGFIPYSSPAKPEEVFRNIVQFLTNAHQSDMATAFANEEWLKWKKWAHKKVEDFGYDAPKYMDYSEDC